MKDTSPAASAIVIIIYIAFLLFPWLITLIKKKKQLGKTWNIPNEKSVIIKDKKLTCPHCQNDQFSKVEGLLTTSWVTFFHFAFWNRSASCFVCSKCASVQWFLSPEEKPESK